MRRRGWVIAIGLAVLACWAVMSRGELHAGEARDDDDAAEVIHHRHSSASRFHADGREDENEHEAEDEDALALVRGAGAGSDHARDDHHWSPSPQSDVPASIRIENTCDDVITLLWIDFDGAEREYTRIGPGRFVEQSTFERHEWLVRTNEGDLLARFASVDGDVVVPCADGTSSRAHASLPQDVPPARCPICSPASTTHAAFSVESHCRIPVQLVWRDFRGATRDYGTIAPGAVVTQHSYVGHRWEVIDGEGATVARYVVEEDGEHVIACM